MAVNAVIKANGIEGNSTVEQGSIQIFSYSWGASISHSMGVGANDSRSGKPDFQDLHITKALDATSPFLLEKMCKNDPITELTLKYFKNIKETNAMYIEYKLTNAFVTSLQQSGSTENPVESVSFAYDKIEFSYHKENASNDGVELAATKGYDIKTNTPV